MLIVAQCSAIPWQDGGVAESIWWGNRVDINGEQPLERNVQTQ